MTVLNDKADAWSVTEMSLNACELRVSLIHDPKTVVMVGTPQELTGNAYLPGDVETVDKPCFWFTLIGRHSFIIPIEQLTVLLSRYIGSTQDETDTIRHWGNKKPDIDNQRSDQVLP
jgi:hypothetical protein